MMLRTLMEHVAQLLHHSKMYIFRQFVEKNNKESNLLQLTPTSVIQCYTETVAHG